MSLPIENSNAAGFEDFYRTNFARVARFSARRLDDVNSGPDAAQEVFLRAWLTDVHRDHPQPGRWLGAAARNHTTDLIRRRQSRPVETTMDPDIDPTEPRNPIENILNTIVLVEALSHVTEEQRFAVTEFILNGRPQKEVAAEAGVPVGTIRSRIHYGLSTMRRVLNERGFNGY